MRHATHSHIKDAASPETTGVLLYLPVISHCNVLGKSPTHTDLRYRTAVAANTRNATRPGFLQQLRTGHNE